MTVKEHLLLKEQGNLNAFPMLNPGPSQNDEYGLTKREYFAALALQGLLSQSQFLINSEKFAKFAVEAADALMAELNK